MYAIVMQHLEGLSYGIFKITYATNITFATIHLHYPKNVIASPPQHKQ
jgi:hypothetical protein